MDRRGADANQNRMLGENLFHRLLVAIDAKFPGNPDTGGHPIFVFTEPSSSTLLCSERIVFCSRDVLIRPKVKWAIWPSSAAALATCNSLHVGERRELLLSAVDVVDTFNEANSREGIGGLAVALILDRSDGAFFYPVDGRVFGGIVVSELEKAQKLLITFLFLFLFRIRTGIRA